MDDAADRDAGNDKGTRDADAATEPASTEPGSTDPSDTALGSTGLGSTEPSDAQLGSADPGRGAPDQPSPGSRDLRTAAQRRADALEDICRLALTTNKLPDHGGQRPTVTVTLDYDTLTQQIGTATLNTGEPISASAARRIACDARVIPAVLNTNAEVLDVGRSRRFSPDHSATP